MDLAAVLALINTWIVANGNNEITANVLRPILEEMVQQPNDLIGVLDDLDTTDKTNLVAAINNILSANIPAKTALRPINTTGVDFNQSELEWVKDAINNTIASNGDFTCNNGEMMVFFCDVLMTSATTVIVGQRRYYRLTTGASTLTTISDLVTIPLMPDGAENFIIDPTGSLVIDLGDIAAADVWTAFNSDGSEPFAMNDDMFVIAVQSSEQKVWKWVGGTGSFGNSATPSVATDFVDLTDAANNPPPVAVDYKPLKEIPTTPYTLIVEDFNRLLVFTSNNQEVFIDGTLVELAVEAGVQSLRTRALFLGTGTHDVTDPVPTEYNYAQNAKVDIECYEVDSTGLWVLKEIGAIDAMGDMTKAVYDPDNLEENVYTEYLMFACSDEDTALTTGTAKITFRMPYAMTLTGIRSNVKTAPTGANLIVDVQESGATILSTLLSIDAGEKTSTTATTPPVISDSALADDAEMTVEITQIGSTIAGSGLKLTLIGTRA